MTGIRFGTVGIVLAVLLLGVGALVGGAAADAPAAEEPAENGTAEFDKWVYEVTTDNATAMEVTLENTDTARLQFGDASVAYGANVTITDGNGDGTVTVLFDTAAAGDDAMTFSVANDADSVTLQDEVSLNRDLGGMDVPVMAYVDGTETDAVTVLVRDPLVRTTPTPTRTPTATDTPTTTSTPTDSGTTTTTSPGMGLAVALVALLAAALLARR